MKQFHLIKKCIDNCLHNIIISIWNNILFIIKIIHVYYAI